MMLMVYGGLDIGHEDVWRMQLQVVHNFIAVLLQFYKALNIILCVCVVEKH